MASRQDPSNAYLIERSRAGENVAFRQLQLRYDGCIRGVVRRYSLDPAAADDAVQNTWLRLFERADTIREPQKLGAWLATTARRESLAEIRRRRHEVHCDPNDIERPCPDPSPEDAAIRQQARQIVRLAIGGLTGRARALIDELYGAATPAQYIEVAQRLRMPIGSIGPTRARALSRLGRMLSEIEYPVTTG